MRYFLSYQDILPEVDQQHMKDGCEAGSQQHLSVLQSGHQAAKKYGRKLVCVFRVSSIYSFIEGKRPLQNIPSLKMFNFFTNFKKI